MNYIITQPMAQGELRIVASASSIKQARKKAEEFGEAHIWLDQGKVKVTTDTVQRVEITKVPRGRRVKEAASNVQ